MIPWYTLIPAAIASAFVGTLVGYIIARERVSRYLSRFDPTHEWGRSPEMKAIDDLRGFNALTPQQRTQAIAEFYRQQLRGHFDAHVDEAVSEH